MQSVVGDDLLLQRMNEHNRYIQFNAIQLGLAANTMAKQSSGLLHVPTFVAINRPKSMSIFYCY